MTLLKKTFDNWLDRFSHRPITSVKTVVLNRHQIFILPTRVGFLFVFMLFGFIDSKTLANELFNFINRSFDNGGSTIVIVCGECF